MAARCRVKNRSVNPIAMTIVFCLVFSSLLGNGNWKEYAPYLLAGMAVWAFLRPMLSPRLAELHRDAFIIDGDAQRSTVDLAAHRGDSTLDDLDLDTDEETTDLAA